MLPAAAIAGAVIAAVVGAVATWSHDAGLLDGALVAIVPGLLLGAFLAWTARRS